MLLPVYPFSKLMTSHSFHISNFFDPIKEGGLYVKLGIPKILSHSDTQWFQKQKIKTEAR